MAELSSKEEGRNWRQGPEIAFELMRIEELLRSNVFSPVVQPRDTFFWSAIIEILILLRDLSVRARAIDGAHLAWSDDIPVAPNLYSDIFGLIKFCRDGLCHTHTFHSIMDERNNLLSRAVASGKKAAFIRSGESVTISTDYEDDVAIFVGAHRLYVKRHIVRASRELRQIFLDAGTVRELNGLLLPKWPSPPSGHSTTG